ncbi:DUF602-domain-containing protein [Xylona heveae TC161]|uniref:DUF602-domain-containing protein n=1 Tax=Xylona heveae (strain CBS 132557 / TC161) TaxID=1328760 RepID=A0A161VZV7_XYLHT|nr:DUF602-domain-containing protein [Xylona heveae TC161]KZF22873.1 DUF602-domain-containing protein [Xylona heveae TC161]
MGNDGGSIPTRRELVKEASRNPTTSQVKESQSEQQEYHWTTCPLSHRPLALPVVSDSSGKLYNKDAVLESLLPSSDGNKADNEQVLQGRVRSLRDVVEVKFQEDKEPSQDKNPRGQRWVCPVTKKTLGPGIRAVYLVPCGHAYSESAVRELAGENCQECNEPCAPENIIPILPTSAAEIEKLAARANKLKEQGLTHSLKKALGSSKKRKKNGETSVAAETGASSSSNGEKDAKSKTATKAATPQPTSGTATPSNGIKNAATASLTAKVLEEEAERNKRRKYGTNDNIKSLFSSGNGAGKDGDFMTRGFSIPAGAKR